LASCIRLYFNFSNRLVMMVRILGVGRMGTSMSEYIFCLIGIVIVYTIQKIFLGIQECYYPAASRIASMNRNFQHL
jgi:hypothetical protein